MYQVYVCTQTSRKKREFQIIPPKSLPSTWYQSRRWRRRRPASPGPLDGSAGRHPRDSRAVAERRGCCSARKKDKESAAPAAFEDKQAVHEEKEKE